MPQKTGVTKAEMMDEMEEAGEMVSTVQFSVPDGKGLREWAAVVEYSWEHEVNEGELVYSHVTEIFSDHVIICQGYGPKSKYFSVPYTVTADGEIEFDMEGKTKVKLQAEWIQKMLGQFAPSGEPRLSVKSIGENTIGGYGILWGDEQHVDLHGEWFSNKTEELTKVFDSVGTIPVLFHHGMDDTLKTSVIGKMKTMSTDDIGLWWEAIVTEHEAYKQYIKPLLDRGLLYSSSGTFPGAKRVDRKSNFIERWPVAEMTMTHTPAEYRFMELPLAEIKSYYKSIGINSDDIFADENSTTEPVTETDAEEAAETAKKQEIELAQMWLDLQNLETNL